MRNKFAVTVSLFAGLAATAPAFAGDLFTVTVTSGGTTSSTGFNTAEDAINQFKSGELNTLLPTYTQTSIATGNLNYRGLAMTATYATAGTTLRFQVPSIGIDQSFTGTTRDDSQKQLLNFLEKNNSYGAIEHALVAVSAVDPVAGNPTSLQSRMVGDGFNSAFATTPGQTGIQPNSVGVGLEYGHFTQSSTDIDAYTLPLSYAFNVGPGDKYRLGIDLPLTYTNTQGAQTGAASLGIGLTVPITDHWSLTPRVAAGATGSLDLGSAAALWSGSVTSAYQFTYDGFGFVVGNMLGYSHSLNVALGSYSVDPKIGDGFTKNGAMISIPTSRFGWNMAMLPGADLQLFATDTRFWGTKLY